jgi:hypothetical protein
MINVRFGVQQFQCGSIRVGGIHRFWGHGQANNQQRDQSASGLRGIAVHQTTLRGDDGAGKLKRESSNRARLICGINSRFIFGKELNSAPSLSTSHNSETFLSPVV